MPRQGYGQLIKIVVSAAVLSCGVIALPANSAAQKPYHVIAHWKIGGTGGWDYMTVDSAAHRLYVTHGPRVEVLDTTTGKPVGAITGLHGTHGVALDTSGKFGFVSDGGGNAVVMFDRGTLAVVATIPAGTNPDGIIFEPATQSVWAFNGRSKDVTVIDEASRKAVATIPLPGKPEFPQVDGKGNVYDNVEDKSEIVHLDAKTKKVLGTWPAGCDSPSGLAFDVPGHRLFPVCDGKKMSVIDSNSGKLIASANIGDGPDAVRWDANKNLVFASSGDDGMMAVVDASKPNYPTVEMLPTQAGARTMEYDAATDHIYTVSAEYGPKPPAAAATPRTRAPMVPDSFTVIVMGR